MIDIKASAQKTTAQGVMDSVYISPKLIGAGYALCAAHLEEYYMDTTINRPAGHRPSWDQFRAEAELVLMEHAPGVYHILEEAQGGDAAWVIPEEVVEAFRQAIEQCAPQWAPRAKTTLIIN